MDPTIYYTDVGIRTRSGAYWFAAIMVIQTVIIQYLRTNDLVRTAIASLFMVAVMISTDRALRQLGRLETQHTAPTDAMKGLFHLALTQPAIACLG